MIRRILTIPCEGGWIVATIDGPAGATRGWVFVTGGSQTRVGPHRLYERLAVTLAARGEAVIRFDRRGVGDSPGDDAGYAAAGPEIASAASALRAAFPPLAEVRGFGLCDGATALALFGPANGIVRPVLANPWVVEPADDLPPAAAIRGHYRERLRDRGAWLRLARGGVDIRRLIRGLRRSAQVEQPRLAAAVAARLTPGTQVVLAEGDGTARAFADAWRRLPDAPAIDPISISTPSHSFATPQAFAQLAAALTG